MFGDHLFANNYFSFSSSHKLFSYQSDKFLVNFQLFLQQLGNICSGAINTS